MPTIYQTRGPVQSMIWELAAWITLRYSGTMHRSGTMPLVAGPPGYEVALQDPLFEVEQKVERIFLYTNL